jgi:hypothetical protein
MPEPINPLEKLSADLSHFATELTSTLDTWKGNFLRNSSASFSTMTPKKWIRLIAVVGAYLLLRPYLLKLGAKVQEQHLEKAMREAGVHPEPGTKINANDLRGVKGPAKVEIPGVESESEDEVGETGKEGQWGRKARVRQRKIVKRAMEIHERNLADKGNESDKDIEDLLED